MLVTGGAGFIGSHLTDRLVADGAEVIVLDDLSNGRADAVSPGARFVEGDVCDSETVRRCVEGVEVVFHLAARKSVSRSVEQPIETDRVNTGGTLTVLAAAQAAGVPRVVSSSSSSVYGGAESRPTLETAVPTPRSPYAVSKAAAEQYCRVYWELHGMTTVSLRYFNVYGPRQLPGGPYAAVVPAFIDALLRGKAPTVHGDGLQSRDFTYVDDVVEANLAAARAATADCAGRAYNVAGGRAVSVLELLGHIQDATGCTVAPRHEPRRPGDVMHSWADLANVQRDLGWTPRTGIDEGLRRTVAWFASSDTRRG